MGIEQFLIKRTISDSFSHAHASMPARKHPPGDGNLGYACLISNCTIPILVHNVLFSKPIKINEF